MFLEQEDIDIAQEISLLAAKFGFMITRTGTRQDEQDQGIGQLLYTGPDENKAEFAEAVKVLLAEREKTV